MSKCLSCPAHEPDCNGLTQDLPHLRGWRTSSAMLSNRFSGVIADAGACPMCAPLRTAMITMHKVHQEAVVALSVSCSGRKLHNERHLDGDADYQTAYQFAPTVAVRGGRG